MLVHLAFEIAPEEKIRWAQIWWPPNVITQRYNMLGKHFSHNAEQSIYSLTARILCLFMKKNRPISAENSRSYLSSTGFRLNCYEQVATELP